LEQPKKNFLQRSKIWLKRKSLGILVIMMILIALGLFFYSDIFVTMHSGQAGVLYERFGNGTVINETYTEGTYFVMPWNRMYIYNVRLQERTSLIEAISVDGLPIKLTISVRFYASIPTLGILHRYVGPNYVENVVMPEVEAKTRDIISKCRSYELYSLNREKIQDSISHRALRAINEEKIVRNIIKGHSPNYVVFENLYIEHIELPKYITAAIEHKLSAEQKSMEYDFLIVSARKEAIRKGIEADGIKSFEQISGISIMRWRGIEATEKLATSNNAKLIVIGTDNKLPVILNGATDEPRKP